MKNILICLFVCLMTCQVQPSFGAFAVKHTDINSHTSIVRNKTNKIATGYKTSKASQFVQRFSSLLHLPHDPNTDIINEKGIFGTLALIFGCLSFIPLYGILFGMAAIILGFVGKHYHQKHSRVGILLGMIGIVANAIFVSVLIIEALGYVSFVMI